MNVVTLMECIFYKYEEEKRRSGVLVLILLVLEKQSQPTVVLKGVTTQG